RKRPGLWRRPAHRRKAVLSIPPQGRQQTRLHERTWELPAHYSDSDPVVARHLAHSNVGVAASHVPRTHYKFRPNPVVAPEAIYESLSSVSSYVGSPV